MRKLYNTQNEIASNIKKFLLKIFPDIRKTQLKIIPYIIIGIILSESVVASDIAKKLKEQFSLVQHNSVVKRINRFFKNKLFSPSEFYDKFIKYVISNYKVKHDDNRIHITMDHMYSRNNFTIFMLTLRIGRQGIPLFFRCFKDFQASEALKFSLIEEGIKYVSSLFDSSYDLIFLADRWFTNFSILNCINDLGHTYCIRFKDTIKITLYDPKEGHEIIKYLSDLTSHKYSSNVYKNVKITDSDITTNIVISKYDGVEEPWIIATNGKPERAVKDYNYRFGSIEHVFKSQKSNGFYLEDIINCSERYFTCMYTMLCFAQTFLTILGADFTKNSKCYKNVKITTHKKNKNGKKIRTMSLFSIGLTLFNRAYNSLCYIRIPFNFILYDV